jgi:molybdopterin-guanine dinucleotide biosynthesis protein A
MEIIVPAAGLSTRFPDMKPKYLLYDYKGEMMLMNALRKYRELGMKINIGILKEHQDKYAVIEQIQHEWPDNLNFVVIDKPTKGPADTVYRILSESGTKGEFLVKDCDSFFDHENTSGNYICVSNISEHEILKKLASKSFVIVNEQDIVTNIIEKQVVSDTFCVGGYKFESAEQYKSAFEYVSQMDGEIFVSDIIGRMLDQGHIFTKRSVTNYVDVGTANDWFEYNDRPVIFCDIDGTIVKAQSRLDLESKCLEVPLQNNVKRLLKLQDSGAQFIFTSARENEYTSLTREMLYRLGFKSFTLICGLQNSRRILINDYNKANPYPRAEAINLYRDSDNLSDFL